MTSTVLRPRKGRLGSGKSTNGCITCKIRKVKCDELHPVCKRCTSTGRKCDGYTTQSDQVFQKATCRDLGIHSRSLPTYGNADKLEIQAFEYFMQNVLPGFTRVVDENFWHQLIPQLGQSDPVIWNALNALSCLIQYPQYSKTLTVPGSRTVPITNPELCRALRWYNKSISGLRVSLQQQIMPSISIVIPCILYMCIECLQDNLPEVMALFQRARGVMQINSSDGKPTTSISRPDLPVEASIRRLLRHISISNGIPVQREASRLVAAERGFESLSAAREELYLLISEAHQFIYYTNEIRVDAGKDWRPSTELVMRQRHHETEFWKWHTALDNTPQELNSGFASNDIEQYSVMLIAYNHYFIWLSQSLSIFEATFDNFIPMFRSVVEHAGRIIAAQRGRNRPVFVSETRVIPSLYFVAIKCRHPIVRRQAIDLLRKGPMVEATWKADAMAEVAERSVAIEESGGSSCEFDTVPQNMELPPENHRIDRHFVVELEDSDGRPANFLKYTTWQQDEDLQWLRVDRAIKI